MKLSVIIVNYNVRHFLEQCLFSVREALQSIEGEIFVIDNNSVDGSCNMVKSRFPEAELIENRQNLGFAKANNQGIRLAKGEYILLLNPDTVVEEDSFKKVIAFMDEHPEAGGLGVKMIDGKGRFLPESKRALPTPLVAFYKVFGLSRIFPKSRIFGKYHLGYLDAGEVHEVEVLSGAFMLLRKKALEKTGLLDEDFFMYGEDIDISYRILQAGYRNYYFPGTAIIHYKGESTKKGSINYVLVFYNAMIIFATKHFSKKNARIFSALINTAIYIRAVIAVISRMIDGLFLPLADAAVIFAGYWFIMPVWEQYKFSGGGAYPKEFLIYAVPSYILIWLISVFFSGGFQRPLKLIRHFRGITAGTIIILLIYALLPEDIRFSRALILIGAAWALLSTIFFRFLLHFMGLRRYKLNFGVKKRIVIVGNSGEAARVSSLLRKSSIRHEMIGIVSPLPDGENSNYIGDVDQMKEIVRINRINEIIFCAGDIPAHKIIRQMLHLSGFEVDYKIASPDGVSIIGSNSMNTAGDLYIIQINSIAREINKRKKRLLDIICAIAFLMLLPGFLFFAGSPGKFIRNIFLVLFGFNTWVGYKITEETNMENLPRLKPGILSPLDVSQRKSISQDLIDRVNILYAKDYKVVTDLSVILRGIRYLGR